MKTLNNKNGFTIIELAIAIFILSLAIVGIYSAFSVMVILTADAVDVLKATYLAQEGMEIVNNIRDSNWIKSSCSSDETDTCDTQWANYIELCSYGCEMDYTTDGVANPIKDYVGNYLKQDENGFYSYKDTGVGTKYTKFKRKITINLESTHVLRVIVQVSWLKKSSIVSKGYEADNCTAYNCVTTEETLYNWY